MMAKFMAGGICAAAGVLKSRESRARRRGSKWCHSLFPFLFPLSLSSSPFLTKEKDKE
jgi:hypothetical protein